MWLTTLSEGDDDEQVAIDINSAAAVSPKNMKWFCCKEIAHNRIK